MNKKIYAVYRKGHIPDEVTSLFKSNGSKLSNLLSLGPTIKIRARQGIYPGEDRDNQHFHQHKEKIYPLTGQKLDLMALDPKPEIEIVLGDTEI